MAMQWICIIRNIFNQCRATVFFYYLNGWVICTIIYYKLNVAELTTTSFESLAEWSLTVGGFLLIRLVGRCFVLTPLCTNNGSPKVAADAQHFHNVYIHLGLCYNDCFFFVVKACFCNKIRRLLIYITQSGWSSLETWHRTLRMYILHKCILLRPILICLYIHL